MKYFLGSTHYTQYTIHIFINCCYTWKQIIFPYTSCLNLLLTEIPCIHNFGIHLLVYHWITSPNPKSTLLYLLLSHQLIIIAVNLLQCIIHIVYLQLIWILKTSFFQNCLIIQYDNMYKNINKWIIWKITLFIQIAINNLINSEQIDWFGCNFIIL